jgi:hypothetical protein
MKKQYQVSVKAEWLVIVDDADSLEEAKQIVEEIYIGDDWHDVNYDYHYEWEIEEDGTYEIDEEEV